ncbi:MAG: nucleotidyltransferase substrate binding protein [Anaerolineales bacterium]|nr:nucleotidyltransferase substrate binding protein [Anaerolineales bacterium]
MSTQDIRWIQRFGHYSRAVGQLRKFIEKKELNELEEQGLIQAFEYTYELAWNTMKDYFESQGETDLHGSRDVFRLAFKRGLIEDGETWMDMVRSRTLTSHTYNEELAKQIATTIVARYFPEFVKLQTTMQSLKDKAA